MFRLNHLIKLSNVTSRIILTRTSLSPNKTLYAQAFFNHQIRFYSKDSKDPPEKNKVLTDKEKACNPKKPSAPKVVLKECKPVSIRPCQPPKPPVEPASKIPYLDDCKPKETKLKSDDCVPLKPEPQPECPYEETNTWDNYKNAVWLGLLMAAATLATLYSMGFFDKKEVIEEAKVEKKKRKRTIIKDPKSSKEIPNEVAYLLIGGGTASFAAFRAIKSEDPTAKVVVITNESFFPYMRPPLSKEMWFNDDPDAVKKLIFKQWNGSERNLYYEPEDFYIKCKELNNSENGGVAVARGHTVSYIDPVEKIAVLSDGYEIHYDKCLIATGATPKNLGVFEVAAKADPEVEERVRLFRNIYDFEDVYEGLEDSKSVAIIGGGFLGSELACAMARKSKKNKKTIYQLFREDGNLGKILPEYLSSWTTKKVRAEGVNVVPQSEVVGVKFADNKLNLVLNSGRTLIVDQAVVAVGVEPNTEMAQKSNLEVDPELGGFLVNTELMARSNLYIAGDCACFYDAKLGRRRIEHHDHAVVTGRLAGENMTGKAKPYLHQSMFWSDLGPDVGYEAIGIIDAALPTVGVFAKATAKDTPKAVVTETDEGIRSKTEADAEANSDVNKGNTGKVAASDEKKVDVSEDYGKGIVFYLRDDVVVGIVLWNVFNRMSIARQVLKDERKYDDLNEVAKLFNIHED